MSISSNSRISRRSLLAGIGTAAVAGGAASMVGCSSKSSQKTNTAAKNASTKLPAYIAYTGAKPDLAGTEQGVMPGFFSYPKDPPKAVAERPGTGKEVVTGMAPIYYAVPPGPNRNSYWAGLNERLGVDLRMQMVGSTEYEQKPATTIAGADLPDAMLLEVTANFPQMLDKLFTPLDEFLAGDAINDYPNLANVPTLAWQHTIYNGHIYGIPIPRATIMNYNFIRQDIFDAVGVSSSPKGYDELVETTKALTDPKKRRWAFSLVQQPRNLLGMMNNEPNGWRYADGKLTNQVETDEYRRTVSDLTAMWKSGVIHPNAFSDSQNKAALFMGGTCCINSNDGYVTWSQFTAEGKTVPGFKLGLMETYNREGTELAHWHNGPGIFHTAFTGLKKQDSKDKLKLILRVLDYLAAPFGTEEYLYRIYGQEGVDHTLTSDGDPVLTAKGLANTVVPVRYLADAPSVIYQPGRPQDVKLQHEYQSKEIPTGVQDPTLGLFSDAAASKGDTVSGNLDDGVNQIIQGRKPLSELDSLLDAWRSGGGDAMRKEYLDQLDKKGSAAHR